MDLNSQSSQASSNPLGNLPKVVVSPAPDQPSPDESSPDQPPPYNLAAYAPTRHRSRSVGMRTMEEEKLEKQRSANLQPEASQSNNSQRKTKSLSPRPKESSTSTIERLDEPQRADLQGAPSRRIDSDASSSRDSPAAEFQTLHQLQTLPTATESVIVNHTPPPTPCSSMFASTEANKGARRPTSEKDVSSEASTSAQTSEKEESSEASTSAHASEKEESSEASTSAQASEKEESSEASTSAQASEKEESSEASTSAQASEKDASSEASANSPLGSGMDVWNEPSTSGSPRASGKNEPSTVCSPQTSGKDASDEPSTSSSPNASGMSPRKSVGKSPSKRAYRSPRLSLKASRDTSDPMKKRRTRQSGTEDAEASPPPGPHTFTDRQFALLEDDFQRGGRTYSDYRCTSFAIEHNLDQKAVERWFRERAARHVKERIPASEAHHFQHFIDLDYIYLLTTFKQNTQSTEADIEEAALNLNISPSTLKRWLQNRRDAEETSD